MGLLSKTFNFFLYKNRSKGMYGIVELLNIFVCLFLEANPYPETIEVCRTKDTENTNIPPYIDVCER